MSDLPLLNGWTRAPHVARWWDADDPFDESDLVRADVAAWVVSLGDVPFAYIQDYGLHGAEPHPYDHLPKGTRGIDQFIGLVDMTGKGHGPAFIRQHMAALYDAGAPVIVTDPHPDNARALSAYRKAGFRADGPVRETEWGRVQLMLARP